MIVAAGLGADISARFAGTKGGSGRSPMAVRAGWSKTATIRYRGSVPGHWRCGTFAALI